MFMRFATFMLWLASAALSHHAAASNDLTGETAVVHTLSLHVSVGGEEVMAPVFQMTSAAAAELFIGSSEQDGYTLVVNMLAPAGSGVSDGAGAQFVLWRGVPDKGVRLLDQVMVLGEKRKKKAGENVLHSPGAGQPVVLTVVSHAMQTVARTQSNALTPCKEAGEAASPGLRSSTPDPS